jgi:hypothetical protein
MSRSFVLRLLGFFACSGAAWGSLCLYIGAIDGPPTPAMLYILGFFLSVGAAVGCVFGRFLTGALVGAALFLILFLWR